MPSGETDKWFLEQVEREHTRLRMFIRSKGVRAEEVDDLAQEAILISLKKIDQLDRDGDFGAWVRQIARRLIANDRRKEARRNRLLSSHVTDVLLEMDAEEDLNARAGIMYEDELAALRECLSRMPAESRDLLHQRYFEELNAGAIGAALGKSSNQIRRSLFRIRRSILLYMRNRAPITTV
jgi:RNA polymerase sigma-70 factor, ECF subfamily